MRRRLFPSAPPDRTACPVPVEECGDHGSSVVVWIILGLPRYRNRLPGPGLDCHQKYEDVLARYVHQRLPVAPNYQRHLDQWHRIAEKPKAKMYTSIEYRFSLEDASAYPRKTTRARSAEYRDVPPVHSQPTQRYTRNVLDLSILARMVIITVLDESGNGFFIPVAALLMWDLRLHGMCNTGS
ncbi:hypothetical protein Hypma_003977 [Hypsizygus marmoreus]|uniref:Uncharacterized protein n=1 Tax=Hypsizygus marmoreus TaxID=39966 RepID=A0A369J101_HYPMA|nr:hypothetical protein Hypma_003977 [Hypsizygus marmoreus]